MRKARACLGVICTLAFVACGLEVTGAQTQPDLAPIKEVDATITGDARGPSTIEEACEAGTGSDLLILLKNETDSCPTGTREQTRDTLPTAAEGACSCGTCTVSSEPSCAGADLRWEWGGNSACTDGPELYNITGDRNCITLYAPGPPRQIAAFNHWDRKPRAGACTATAAVDSSKVAFNKVRTCTPEATTACAAPRTANQRLCVVTSGVCTGELSERVVIGDEPAARCESCGCTRTSTECVIDYFSDEGCNNLVHTHKADGNCAATNSPTLAAIRVFPSPPTCNLTPTKPLLTVTNERTLCCTP